MKTNFTIVEDLLVQLDKKLQFINRKAKKINVPEVSYQITGTEIVDDIKYVTIETDVEPVKIEGYKVVATIEHTYAAANIVHKIHDDITLPEDIQTRDGFCEHCNTSRKRKNTVLLQSTETGEFIQVGKSCLKDYLGHDLNKALSIYEAVEDVEEFLSDCFSHGEGWTKYYNVKDVLNIANEYINRFGYVSAQDATEENPKTGNIIWEIIEAIKTKTKLKTELEFCKELYELDQLTTKVQEVMEWVKGQEPDSQYMNNVKVIIEEGFVQEKHINILVSIIATYNRHLEKMLKEKAKQELNSLNLKNEHYGEVGSRQDFNLKCVACYVSEGFYGITYVNKLIDEEGRTFVWFTSTKGFEQGQEVTLKGTIKEHSEFNGEKQTVLTRCKLAK